jgi:cysteinyl-tRNA synthetase
MRSTNAWRATLFAIAVAGVVAGAAANEPVGLRSWGYQLQHIDPARLASAPYDVIVIDYSRDGSDGRALTAADVERLKFKPDGTRRVVLAYMSIGEAENYRYYWHAWWNDAWGIPNPVGKPAWRGQQNARWDGNYAVKFWEPGWQEIIVGDGGYLDRILKAGFDGVWLDKVDSTEDSIAHGHSTARADMIAFVRRIAVKARAARPGFLVFPQNGEALLADAGYRELIDGFGREDLLYGEEQGGLRNRAESTRRSVERLKPLVAAGKPVLVVEYIFDRTAIDAARVELAGYGFVPHFADRKLNAMRIGDYASVEVATTERPTSKHRVREKSTFDIWKTRVLLAAAGLILLMGLMRRHRSF